MLNYEKSQKEIIRRMQRLSPKYGMHNVFRDFTTLAACTISNSIDKQQWQHREDLYMRTIEKYDKKEANTFAEIFALVTLGLSGGRMGDFLGELYMQLEIGNKNSGQFFTPYHVSKLMSQLGEVKPNENGIIELNEPAVGSGGMVIAYAENMKRQGFNYQTQLRVICNDIDYNVVKMCYIQLSLLGIDAVVMQGDTITLKMNEYWYTPMHFMNKVREQEENKTKNMVEGMRKAITLIEDRPTRPRKQEQMALF